MILKVCGILIISLVGFEKVSSEIFVDNKSSCFAALDIVQVQDMTSSFDNLWTELAPQVELITEKIKKSHKDSHFGIVTFGDKNISGFTNVYGDPNRKLHLGFPNDYCARVDVPLSAPNPEFMNFIFTEYRKTFSGGGGDWPEAALEAVYRTIFSDKINWRKSDASKNQNFARLIVLVTDAMSHVEGDVKKLTGKEVMPFNLTNKLDDINEKCAQIDYPSVQQLVDLLEETKTYLIILAATSGIHEGTKFFVDQSLSQQGIEFRNKHGVYRWYKKIFENATDRVLIQELDPKMTAYAAVFEHALNDFKKQLCKTQKLNKKNKIKSDLSQSECVVGGKLSSLFNACKSGVVVTIEI